MGYIINIINNGDNMPLEYADPYRAFYMMRLQAMRFGSYPTEIQRSEDGTTTQQLTDGTTIQLTIDHDTMTWMLARFFHEQGKMIVLYQEHGTYDDSEYDEDTGEYIP